ncbi:DUF1345 domain-containing protein [Microvirga antarctica]|uniref:DUF1345 domain-containing protein n=1 Tax=Microvirga antarctica TaxID=2819233 RepID=UPI001B300FB4|nr:DUF1345 domain-containing protein [Microvirga antarctica]
MFFNIARLRPRLVLALLVGLIVAAALPGGLHPNTRFLISWDVAVTFYVLSAVQLAATASIDDIRKRSNLEDAGATAILFLTIGAAVASLAAIGIELLGIHDKQGGDQALRLIVAGLTILCSWFFVHTIWAIHYAHEFYGDKGERRGLAFPKEDSPDYFDFFYFSFNMGAAAQTSDVTVVSRNMRRLVLCHTILSFLFNTTILALAINVGASVI